jgi:hypothetical protein
MLTPFKGVNFEKRYVAVPDCSNMEFRVVPKRACGGDVEWYNDGAPKRIGHLYFNQLGHLTEYADAAGHKRPIKDQPGTPYQVNGPPSITVLNALFDKELGARASRSDVRKLPKFERAEREKRATDRWKRLFRVQFGNEYDGTIDDLRRMNLDRPPLACCSRPPKAANDNLIRFGLPYGTLSAAHLSMTAGNLVPNAATGLIAKTQTALAIVDNPNPEAVLILRQDLEQFKKDKSLLSAEDLQAFESGAYAANNAQIGSETGDSDKSKKTQERNGWERFRRATANFAAISEGLAA